MKLATVESVLHTINFDAIETVNRAIDMALEQATDYLENLIRTPFARVAGQVDLFSVGDGTRLITGLYQTKLALSYGFLTVDAVLVEVAGSFAGLVANETDDITAYAGVSREKGSVMIHGIDLTGKFVRITHTAGFEADSGDAELYKQAQVPTWLKSAARVGSIAYLDATSPSTRHDDSPQSSLVDNMQEAVVDISTPHIRYLPGYIQPLPS